jgi:hypothetical protein
MVSLLVSRRPEACRAHNERAQADLVYTSQRDGRINVRVTSCRAHDAVPKAQARHFRIFGQLLAAVPALLPCRYDPLGLSGTRESRQRAVLTARSLGTPFSLSGTGAPEPTVSAPMVTDYVRDGTSWSTEALGQWASIDSTAIDYRRAPVQQALCVRCVARDSAVTARHVQHDFPSLTGTVARMLLLARATGTAGTPLGTAICGG